jgi:hypothetical protein
VRFTSANVRVGFETSGNSAGYLGAVSAAKPGIDATASGIYMPWAAQMLEPPERFVTGIFP